MYDELYGMISKIKLYTKKEGSNNNRLGFPTHRGCLFGMVKAKYKGIIELSYYSRKYPDIHDAIMKVGKTICPFEFTQVQVNHNLVCPPHKDKANKTNSMIVSFGEYTGGLLVIEGVEHNTYHAPLQFDGVHNTHWNTPLIGNKYSLIFFS